MILKVYYETEKEKKIAHIKNKKIITQKDVEHIKKLIEKKTGDKVIAITNWKIIGTLEEHLNGRNR